MKDWDSEDLNSYKTRKLRKEVCMFLLTEYVGSILEEVSTKGIVYGLPLCR